MMTPLLPLWDHAEPFDLIPLGWFCGLCLLMAVHGLYVWLRRRHDQRVAAWKEQIERDREVWRTVWIQDVGPDRRADDWAAEGEGVGRW